ncbi:hypothetical protein EAI_03578 [Harpegnathos saltator]|uniref:Uncharacterized protein n=2 Tax=Harpegnathos saltator TaxID=610380 RepID=E2B868_HARSA|nr:hypothetical protein EAI_03578 [Harpegnathos saltator]
MDDFRRGTSMGFNISSDPFEATRHFLSIMDNILHNFGLADNFYSFSEDRMGALALPAEKEVSKTKKVLRDRMLKSAPDSYAITPDQKVDTDLDGKISTENFSKMWRWGHEKTVEPPASHSFFIGKFMKTELIRSPDGTLVQKQVISDNEGNKETIVSKEIGDQKYIVTTKTDKYGVETKSENLINMDKSELEDFNKKWARSVKDNRDEQNLYLNCFPWNKFFGPGPKL